MSGKARDLTRALISLKEEIEAIDWYNQRMECAEDDSLRKILEHNRNEEIEHAVMAIEWLRRNMDGWDENLRAYLFTEGAITEIEGNDKPEDYTGEPGSGLGIGQINK
jgi:hypothetical protein